MEKINLIGSQFALRRKSIQNCCARDPSILELLYTLKERKSINTIESFLI
jgi:hypothetical protein